VNNKIYVDIHIRVANRYSAWKRIIQAECH